MEDKGTSGTTKPEGPDAYRTRIQQLEREIRVNQSIIDDELRNVGEILFQHSPDLAIDGDVDAACEEARSTQATIVEVRAQIERIQAIVAHVEEITQKVESHETEIKKLIQTNIPHYEKIGQAAFEYYQENPFNDQEHADIFTELVRNQQELADLETAIRSAESEMAAKPLFDRVISRGRLALIKNRRQSKLASFPRLFRIAGEKLSSTEFGSMVQDDSIAKVAGPFLENVRKIELLRGEVAKLSNERSSLEAEQDQICQGKKPRKRISDLESELKAHYEGLTISYRKIGRKYREKLGPDDKPLPEVREYMDSVSDTEKETSKRKAAIEKLQAAIEIIQLERESSHMQTDIHSLEEQVSKQQQEITSLNEKIHTAEQEMRRLARIRGPVEKLADL